MTYKEFKKWCNDRLNDGNWVYYDARWCIDTIDYVNKHHFWKRNKIWKSCYESWFISEIYNPSKMSI